MKEYELTSDEDVIQLAYDLGLTDNEAEMFLKDYKDALCKIREHRQPPDCIY